MSDPAPDSRPDRTPYLRIQHLTKRFGHFTALHDISLDIYEGEFVCFLGPSGCGKTTLLRAIAGLDIQTSGRIEQAGRDISALPPQKRDFGIVFQSYALFPNLTVARNVAYGLENRRMKKADIARRVQELLDMVGLGDQGVKYPAQLSGGQQQRVALTRALATSPGLLLLDEPLSALDAKVRVYLRHEVRQLQRRLGITTIMVTHDQEEALTMADRIVVMNHGVIEQIGAPIEIYRRPASAFVADFIGLMNFVPGTMVGPGRVRLGRLELACEADGFAPGTGVTIAIRPEDIRVLDVQGTEENAFAARIEAMFFLGSFFRVDLAADALGDTRLRADVAVEQVRRLDLAEGGTLHVMMPRRRIRVYPGGPDSG
jgi:iron(III) transport system ATP-binding protein